MRWTILFSFLTGFIEWLKLCGPLTQRQLTKWPAIANRFVTSVLNETTELFLWGIKKMKVLLVDVFFLLDTILRAVFFSLRHFGHFLLIHFSHRDISVICLTVVSKLAVAVFYIFRHSDRNVSILLAHFKNISVYDQKNRLRVNQFVFVNETLA